jgi:hypothetical protein
MYGYLIKTEKTPKFIEVSSANIVGGLVWLAVNPPNMTALEFL